MPLLFGTLDNRRTLEWIAPTTLPDLSGASMLAIDLETRDDSLNADGAPGGVLGLGHVAGVSVATDRGDSYYFPLRHPESKNWVLSEFAAWWKRTMLDARPKVGANIQYDLEWLRHEGLPISGPFWDVQIAEPLLNETRHTYSLGALSREYLPEEYHKADTELADIVQNCFGKVKEPGAYIWKLPAHLVGAYAEMDALATLKVFEAQRALLHSEGLWELFELESALIPLLVDMRFRGVRVDKRRAEQSAETLDSVLDNIQRHLDTIAGRPVNVNSSADVAELLQRNGSVLPMTAKGAPSVTATYLEHSADPVAREVLNVRRLSKLLNTFLRGVVLEKAHGDRIHCQFNQLRSDAYGTVSGRFSSSRPNLQQIPNTRDGIEGVSLRGLFVPEPGMQWWKIDWSQIEVRFLIHYAVLDGAPGAKEAQEQYRRDNATDFHAWAAELTGVPRKQAKGINFGLIYGMGKAKLCASLGLGTEEGNTLFSRYHAAMPFARALSERVQRVARNRGYIKTVLGRRRRFNLYAPAFGESQKPVPLPEALQAYGPNVRRTGVHAALNQLLQGSAADLMKKAMVMAYDSGVLQALGYPALTVHDELDGSYDPSVPEQRDALRELVHIMEHAIPLEVPVLATAEAGDSWGTVTEINWG